MKLIPAEERQIPLLTEISKAAFDSDVSVGAAGPGGPSGYDSCAWHKRMLEEGHLLAAVEGDRLLGGAIVFGDQSDKSSMYVGRIFIDPAFFRKGYGKKLMEELERSYPEVASWSLETPVWNRRTNSFYKKLGYREIYRDDGEVRYRKTCCNPSGKENPEKSKSPAFPNKREGELL